MRLQISFPKNAGGNQGFKYIYENILYRLQQKYKNILIEWNDTENLVAEGHTVPGSFGGISNLSIVNLDNKKCSILSFADQAETHTLNNHGYDDFNIVQVMGGLRYSDNEFTEHDISKRYNIDYKLFPYPIPFADFDEFAETHRGIYNPSTRLKKVFFAGAFHGERAAILSHMDKHPLIDTYRWVSRYDYYKLFTQYTMAISLNGNGEFCVRDLESFGLGAPVIRSELKMNRFGGLIPDVHYIRGSDPSPRAWMDYPGYTFKQIAEQFIDRIETTINDEALLTNVANNGLMYYKTYCRYETIVNLFIETFDVEILR